MCGTMPLPLLCAVWNARLAALHHSGFHCPTIPADNSSCCSWCPHCVTVSVDTALHGQLPLPLPLHSHSSWGQEHQRLSPVNPPLPQQHGHPSIGTGTACAGAQHPRDGSLTCSPALPQALGQFPAPKQLQLFMQRVLQVPSQAANETAQEEMA